VRGERVDDTSNFRGRHLHEFKKWRAEDLKPIMLKNRLGAVRLFLQFCERLEVAPMGVNQRLALPDIGLEGEVLETILTKEDAELILDYCKRFEYATLRHALFYLLWHTGMRSSSAHALDVNDYYPREG
jgi:integrase